MRNRTILLLLALLVATPAKADSVTILRVVDGDTAISTGGERIRLACIDAAERGSSGAAAATRSLREQVEGRRVGVRRITRDRYGRTVAELFSNGQNVGQELVNSDHAWVYKRYAYQCPWAR